MLFHQPNNSHGNFNNNAYIYKNKKCESHFHGNYELIYVIQGFAEVRVNTNTITLYQSDLILVPPYCPHSFDIDAKSSIWVGVFSEDFIPAFSSEHRNESFSKFKCSQKSEETLKDILFHENHIDKYLMIAGFNIVCSELLCNATVMSVDQDGKFIKEVVSFISANLNSDLTMAMVAKNLNYEYHYFSTLFNKCFNLNFKKIINYFRYDYACMLLRDSSKSISSIASECGFGSVRNFNRIFKALSNQTPRDFQKNTDVKI
ncbi:MAG: AraC family transcriptional regulator [Clostridiales bacterium]|nr:AraC family transcriptional regulator [Clostridiales bacterium]